MEGELVIVSVLDRGVADKEEDSFSHFAMLWMGGYFARINRLRGQFYCEGMRNEQR